MGCGRNSMRGGRQSLASVSDDSLPARYPDVVVGCDGPLGAKLRRRMDQALATQTSLHDQKNPADAGAPTFLRGMGSGACAPKPHRLD